MKSTLCLLRKDGVLTSNYAANGIVSRQADENAINSRTGQVWRSAPALRANRNYYLYLGNIHSSAGNEFQIWSYLQSLIH